MKKLVMAALLSTPLLVSIPAAAQEGPGGPSRGEERFQEMDINGDGEITRAEMAETRTEKFAEADANGDGLLSYDEGIAAHKARMEEKGRDGGRHKGGKGKFFARMDIDGDGFVSLEETEVMSDRRFTDMDANLDGAVTYLEAKAAFKAHKGKRSKDRR